MTERTRRHLRRSLQRSSSRNLHHETLEKRELLAAELGAPANAPILISVSANAGEQFNLDANNRLDEAPTELKLRFDGSQQLDPNTLSAIQFRSSGGDGSFNEGNEQVIRPGFLGFDDAGGSRVIVARFAETLADDQYVLEIAGYDDTNVGIVGLRNIGGDLFCPPGAVDPDRPVQQILFEVEVGPRVVAVVPQPIDGVGTSRLQRRDQIHVFFNDDPLSNPAGGPVSSASGSTLSVVNPQFYQLIFTQDTVENTDDSIYLPTSVTYDPALNRAVLTYASDLSELGAAAASGSAGTFRLRIGSGDTVPITSPMTLNASGGSEDTFAQALPLGMAFGTGVQSIVVTEGLIESPRRIIPQWPGAADAAGLRDDRRDSQLSGRIDTTHGINVFPYNFASLYGTDPQLNRLSNAITEAQKQRAREVLDLFSQRLGVQFIETADQGLQIVTGDIRAIVISADTSAGADTPYSLYRVNDRDPSQGVLVLDAAENWFDGYGLSPDSRPSWFVEAIRGIGNLLGIGDLFELPQGVGAGGSSPDEANAVSFSDQFFPNLPNEPEFLSQSDVTLGQALHRPESSDVDFYSFQVTQNGRLAIETFAQRLDGSSLLDSHLNLYRVINAAANEYELIARNDDFYSDDSFIGIDVVPGNYIVGVSAAGNEGYNGNVSGSGLGGVTEGRYEMRVTFTSSAGATITDTNGTKLDGDADGKAGGDFNFWFRTARDVSVAASGQPRMIFISKDGDDIANGALSSPVRTIKKAFQIARPGDVVRLLPSAGADNLITTTNDNLAYEIGFGGTGNAALADGSEFEVPKGVTVMIDAGAILKLRGAKISVGSESFDEDRSLAALQVLGTPVMVQSNPQGGPPIVGSGEVFFTSYDDQSLGVDTNPLNTLPNPGHWAGIEFRNDFDYAEGRAVWETEGIFLDYASHANLKFGGGSIAVDQPIVTPIQMRESRPTLIYNTITRSADAAISADPNSFLETNFHAPIFQRVDSFTSDYDRIGPEISGNKIFDNSINGLFIRVNTPAAGQLEPMTVSGRLDDTDITHVLSQVLVLQGQPGGPLLLQERPNVSNVVVSTIADGNLDATKSYQYRLTFVDVDGSESLASMSSSASAAAASGTRAVRLNSLPPALEGFVGRRLYRSIPGSNDFEFVTQLDRASQSYIDDGTTRGGLLRAEVRPDASGVSLASATSGGSLVEGLAYDYRFVFVDSADGESTPSDPTTMIVASETGAVELTNLPQIPEGYESLRIYRLDPVTGVYHRVTTLLPSQQQVVDSGNVNAGLQLQTNESSLLLPRFDARLSIDPGIVVKLQSARIEAGFGSDFYAEGTDGKPIVFTSRLDDTFGAGGTFDTNNDGIADNAEPGDWGGLVFRQDSTASLDHVQSRYGGGTTSAGGGFTEFNAVEILQADVRIANSRLSRNAAGFVSQSTRDGIGFNEDATIFIRGSQPIIVNNTIVSNDGAAISINPDALNYDDVLDMGRSTGPIDLINSDLSNQGPLIAGNMLSGNEINAMRIRSELLTTESVWDDTDIVHVVDGEITSATHHFRGGLRLKSDADQSLVVKFTEDSTLVGTGRPLDITDRIGGTLQVLGTPGNPVVLTSINDCTVGAGFTPDGRPMNDTLGSGACSGIIVDSPIPFVDVIVVMDESGSMGFTQQFSAQFIQDLDAGLLAAGIGTTGGNLFGAVGFGGFPSTDPANLGRSILVGGNLFGTSAEYAAATSQFVTSGFAEDGYAGINFALQNYSFRPEAAKFIILATDEPRSIEDANLSEAGIIASLQAADVNLQGILGILISDASGQRALAIDNDLVYTESGTTFTATPGGTIFGGASVADYLGLVQATDGISGDLSQIGASTQTANVFSQALISSIVGQAGGTTGSSGAPGDWQGLQLGSDVNDRNVAYVLEQERAIAAAAGENANAAAAQLVGNLADHEYAGDETERLGFNIRGTLVSPEDQDVYRFDARGGTAVYIDIDDTSFGLDTVVELIDINDNVLARSDNSFSEANGTSSLFSNLPAGTVRPLYQQGVGNVESPNPLDAGMRVVLPGSSTTDNKYFVRVRTAAGQTQGQYQLSLRLRETDEIAGSTIQLADIRFATNAITVSGAPLHSPLTGDATESLDYTTIIDPTPGNPNNNDEYIRESANNFLSFTPAQADRLGNLLTTDRGSLVVSGVIGNVDPSFSPNFNRVSSAADVRLEDVDVYQVDLFSQQISPDVFDSENRFVSVTFDIDYADGLGRVNTSLAVYNSAGRLILHSRDSNIADDVGRPTLGNDSANLTGGSAGVLDAHIGPVELPEGTYFVVVSNATLAPQALDQFFNPETTTPNVRLAPINSVRRIAEDTLDDYFIATYDPALPANFFDQLNYTAEKPLLEPVFDQNSIVPYTLDDIRLFVSFDGAITGNNNTILTSFNPFTGTMERLIGQSADPTEDIALRSDGELFAYTLGPATGVENSGNVGQLQLLSPVDGTVEDRGDDGIAFQSSNAAFNATAVDANVQLDVNAIAFPLVDGSTVRTQAITNVNTPGFLVGSRVDNGFMDNGRGFEIPSELTQNIFYQFSAVTGEITSRGSLNANADRNFPGGIPYNPSMGPASSEVEWGVVDTGLIFNSGGDGGKITGIALDADNRFLVYAVTDLGGIHAFDYRVNVAAPETSPAFGYNQVIPTNFKGVIPVDPAHFNSTFATTVQFSGATLGPRTIEDEAYRQILFATTTDGWMYAIDVSGTRAELAPVFYGGRSAIELTFQSGFAASGFGQATPHGLAFSHLEASPWHQTNDRGTQTQHGVEIPHDQSRFGTLGGSSLYYGFEVDANQANNTLSRADDSPLGELAPGGSHGSIISRPFNLEGYSPADKPTLYFTYHIEVEDDDDYDIFQVPVRLQNDSFRVFGSGDDGQWILLATNNSFRDLSNVDEYDYFNDTNVPVQEIFDDRDEWRQARVDISPLAGSENVRIRFDFSTAGSMRSHFGSIDFTGVNADKIGDHQRLTFTDSNFNQVVFDNIVGRDLAFPAGNALRNGEQISVTGPDGPFVVRFVTGTPSALGDVQFNGAMSAVQVARAVFNVLPFSLQPVLEGSRISLLAVTDVTQLSDVPVGQSNPVQVMVVETDARFLPDGTFVPGTPAASQIIVPPGSGVFAGERIQLFGNGVFAILEFVELGDTPSPGTLPVFFTPADSVDTVANSVIAQIPVELAAVYEGNGVITFLNNTFTSIIPSTSAIGIVNPFLTNENRRNIQIPGGNNLVDGETLTFVSPTGTTVVTFVDTLLPSGPGQVSFQMGDNSATIAARLHSILPVELGAIVTGVAANSFVSVTATSVTPGAPVSNLIISPLAFSQNVVHLDIPDAVALRNGEQLRIIAGGQVETITFIERGQSVANPGTIQVFFTDGELASDLYDDIIKQLPIQMRAYVDPNIGGINIAGVGATALIVFNPEATLEDTRDVNESAIPITIPRGSDIRNGETIVVSTKSDVTGLATQTFRFVTAATGALNEIVYNPADSAADVALDVLAQLPRSLQGFLVGTREIHLMEALSVVTQPGSLIVSYRAVNQNVVPLITDATMNSVAVTDRIRAAFAEGFGRFVEAETNGAANPESFKVYGTDRIRLYNVTVDDAGPFGVSSYSLISGGTVATSPVPGDEFGENQPAAYATSQLRQRGAQNNEVEGVYIDDIIIGFAERGEMVLNAPNNQRDFVFDPQTLPDTHPDAIQPERQNEITLGEYSLEIRTSDEYGVPQDYDPINLELTEQAGLGRSFDTNDRLSDGAVTLIAQAGSRLLDGDKFVLDDGDRRVTFEFDSVFSNSVTQGNVRVSFDPSSGDPARVADAIRNAINTQFVAGVLKISAATGDGLELAPSSGGRVELFGKSIAVNPSSGRFIKLDLVAEETFQGRETSRQQPLVNHDAETSVDVVFGDELARAAVPNYVNALTDTIVGIGKIGDAVLTGVPVSNLQDGAVVLGSSPQLDYDSIRVFLKQNQSVVIDVDTVGFSRAAEVLDLPIISVFEQGAVLSENLFGLAPLAQSNLVEAEAAPGEASPGAYLEFTAPADGYYDVVVSSANLFGTTALVVADTATPAALDGQSLSMVVDGFQSILQFTTDPDFSTVNQKIVLDVTDTVNDIVGKIADAITVAYPNRVASIVQGHSISLANTVNVLSPVSVFSSSFEIGTIFRDVDFGEYAITIRPDSNAPGAQAERDVLMVDYHFGKGDVNRVADQGQLIISGNFISNSANYGVVAIDGDRDQAFAAAGANVVPDRLPRPGSARLLRNQNSGALIPGAVISNNVITNSGTGAILFGGDVNVNGEFASPVLFGRIVNNTIVGSSTTDGITISGGASPTVLNNVIAGFGTGILTTANQFGEVVVGGNAYQDNVTNSTLPLASSSFVIPTGTPLFEDAARGIYIPAAGSRVIDSSFASLPERTEFFETVKEPSGIAPSPIIAPITDAYGQQRVDDVTVATPGGVGANVFIDRGALDRADAVRPIAILTGPQDSIGFQVPGGDQDIGETFVRLNEGVVEFFQVQLRDEFGTGIDAATVTDANVLLTENGRALVSGIDYVFGYSSNSRTIRLTSLSGLWRPDAVYEITLNNRDRIALSLPSGNLINDGDQVVITDSSGLQGTFEFDSGYSVQVPQTTTLTVNGTNANFTDGQILTVNSPNGNTIDLEIETGAGVSTGNVAVNLSTAGTIRAVRDAFLAAFASNVPGVAPTISVADYLQLNPVAIANNQVQLGTASGHLISGVLDGAIISGQPGGIVQGNVFTYTTASGSVTFEFTVDGTLSNPTNTPITITASDTPDQIAAAIVAAVRSSGLGLVSAQSLGGGVVLLGGDAADQIDVSASALVLTGSAGVSPGATAVTFLPTSQFTPSSTAATLQSAIAASSLAVQTSASGGGRLLISGAQSVTGTLGSSTSVNLGRLIPAITDLAGNAIRETRSNDETRFTIIMPDVLFDFGDAGVNGGIGNDYATLLANNGARHTISGANTPRLGVFIDAERDGQPGPGDSDDQPVSFTVSQTGGVFVVSNVQSNTSRITTTGGVTPSGGETVRIVVDGKPTTFEFVTSTSNPSVGNIPIAFVPSDTPAELTAKLVAAMRGGIPEVGSALLLAVDANDPTTFTITSIDDEDGVSVGTFVSGGQSYRVFSTPGSGDTVGAGDVLGFLNPADPAGTSLAVTVVGAGLLDLWVDFDENRIFDADEQLLTNAPVVDGLNILTVFTPNGAIGSKNQIDTWARFRISAGGNLAPTGVAIGGEVEDYLISVINEPAPRPMNDLFSVAEDDTLVVGPTSPGRLLLNDIGVSTTLLPTRLFVGEQPRFGTLTITNAFTGEFTYQPFVGLSGATVGFNGSDTFTYRLSTQSNNSGNPTNALFATVTINIISVNDPPVFDILSTVNILEDSSPSTVIDAVTNQAPGPITSPDELELQTISFRIDLGRSTVPAGLMTAAPDVSTTATDGNITFFPAADAVGTATYVIIATDNHPTNPRSTEATFTVNVRPVNDPPQFVPSRTNIGETANADDAYTVGRVLANGAIVGAPITYTLREDNTQALGVTQPYFIPLNTDRSVIGYNRIGLLDVFVAGPPNELDNTPGGSQILRLTNTPLTTSLGGSLTPVMENGVMIGLNYVPPRDLNRQIAAMDSFVYTVIDESTTGGTTFDPVTGTLVNAGATRTNEVQFILNSVNDRPEFTTTTNRVEVREDNSPVTITGYAGNINAGPPLTAFDEVDFNSGQDVIFSVTSLGFSVDQSALFFTQFPTVSPDGTLRFQAAPNVFGRFDFEVVATDNGPGNATRGDLISSLPKTLTIDVQPVNDPPLVDPAAPPLRFQLREDGSVDILIRGDASSRGLLDVFLPGPANEAGAVNPGGNQTVSLGTPVPSSSAQGGNLTPITENGVITRLRYVPRANFTGADSFIYAVTDDGVTVDVNTGGVARPDPRIASNTVTLDVLPVNDAPQFSGAANVVVDEDAGSVNLNAWASNVLAGPSTAVDENGDGPNGQEVNFVITYLSGDIDLFTTAPSASVVGDTATLSFVTAADANGVATYQVQLLDDGPTNTAIGDVNSSAPQTFTIRINPVNDAPAFVSGGTVTVNEDSGPFNALWATNVSPGPADESTQSVRFMVTTPTESQALFQTLPSIGDNGILRFTPANNANGTVDLSVTAIDSEGGQAQAVTLRMVINAVNDVPRANPDTFTNQITTSRPLVGSTLLNGAPFDPNQAVNEDTVLVILASQLLANDVDPDVLTNGDTLTIVMPPQSFSVSGARVTYDAIAGTITYDPKDSLAAQSLAPGGNLLDTFAYSLRDSAGVLSTSTVVSVNVAGVNDAPRLEADAPLFNPNGATIFNPLINDSDLDGTIDPTSIVISFNPARGSLAIASDGTITYTPFDESLGDDDFRYTVADNLGDRSEEATVTISVNAAPIARDDQAAGFLNESFVINVATNDEDPDGSLVLTSIVIVDAPNRGQAVPLGDGTIRYIPESGFLGFDTFKYTISDNLGRASAPADVDVRVIASRLQNPDENLDVSDDGKVSAIDALLVINRLSRAGNTNGIPVGPNDRGPFYYDVNGDQRITTIDALRVINELNRRNAQGNIAQSEAPAGIDHSASLLSLAVFAPIDVSSTPTTSSHHGGHEQPVLHTSALLGDVESRQARFESNGLTSAIDLIAEEREAERDEEETLRALDAAMADLI